MPESTLSSSAAWLHAVYGNLTGLLLILIEIKSQTTCLDPFKEHAAIMMCFLVTIFVYATALMKLTWQSSTDILSFYVCHVSGALACQLLLLVLVTPIWWVVIDASSAILMVALCFCYQHASVVFSLVGTCCFGITGETSSNPTDGEEEPDVEMVAAQAAA